MANYRAKPPAYAPGQTTPAHMGRRKRVQLYSESQLTRVKERLEKGEYHHRVIQEEVGFHGTLADFAYAVRRSGFVLHRTLVAHKNHHYTQLYRMTVEELEEVQSCYLDREMSMRQTAMYMYNKYKNHAFRSHTAFEETLKRTGYRTILTISKPQTPNGVSTEEE